jgi:hypothetical protein
MENQLFSALYPNGVSGYLYVYNIADFRNKEKEFTFVEPTTRGGNFGYIRPGFNKKLKAELGSSL